MPFRLGLDVGGSRASVYGWICFGSVRQMLDARVVEDLHFSYLWDRSTGPACILCMCWPSSSGHTGSALSIRCFPALAHLDAVVLFIHDSAAWLTSFVSAFVFIQTCSSRKAFLLQIDISFWVTLYPCQGFEVLDIIDTRGYFATCLFTFVQPFEENVV